MKQKLCVFSSLIFVLLVQVTFSAFDSADFASEKPLKISRITPDGRDVPAGRQIVIQFNRPVVPLGRMERKDEEIPIEITPDCNCEWRWINTSALACQLGEKDTLKQATKYKVTVNPGIKAEDGTTISERYDHQFITERPKIRHAWFYTWKSPGLPVIRVTFNQAVLKNSVEQHLFMKTSRGKKRYTLKVEPDPDDHEKPKFLPLFGEGLILYVGDTPPEKSDDDAQTVKGVEARRIWLVSPHEELPLDTSMEFRIEPGLVSAIGPEKGITKKINTKFHTFPEFKFLGIRCRTDDLNLLGANFHIFNKREVLIDPGKPLNAQPKCDPLASVYLVFSSPVIKEEVQEHIEFIPDLAGGRDDYDPWENVYSYSRLDRPHRKGNFYTVRFPELLKAWHKYQIKSKLGDLKDEFGRTLPEPIDFEFFTAHRKPDFTLTHNTSVLEKNVDTDVPLYVTNLEDVTLNFTKLTSEGSKGALTSKIDIPEVEDVSFAVPLGVRDMLEGKTGAVYGHLSTKPSVSKYDCEYEFFSQVTPFQVHVKIGHFNTAVWITDMTSGEVISDAVVTIYKDSMSRLSSDKKILSRASTDKNGVAVLAGTETLDPKLDLFYWCSDCFGCERFFVKVEKQGDIGIIPLDPKFEVDTCRASNYSVYPYAKKKYGHIRVWGTTAQGVYKAGDTIQYKIYVRNQDNNRFVPPPAYPYKLKVLDPIGKTVHEQDKIELSEFGSWHGEFTVPKTGAVGWYRFELSTGFTDYTWQPMQVLVSDFTPSPFRVSNEINGDLFHQDDEVEVSSSARLHAGGPYTEAPSRITAHLRGCDFTPKHHEAKRFSFDTYRHQSSRSYMVFQTKEALDDKGNQTNRFVLPDKGILFGRLTVESAVQDDRGKYIASFVSADYVGRDRFVGLRNTKWVYKEDQKARVEFMVVDDHGKPVTGTDVHVTVERMVTKASRVKGAGNAYLTQYIDEWISVSDKTYKAKKGPVSCNFIPSDPGSFRITAAVSDTKGRSHSTQIYAWVAGKGRVVWREPDDNSLQIIPEEKTYNIGEKARYLVKNPFPGATALVTIERYGVLKTWTEKLKTSTPIIEFTVEPDYAPGFYLSVVVASPRVEKPLGEGNVDLGKPAFRIGYVSVPVKDPYKEIIVNVKPEEDVYKPRDKVTVKLNAKPRHLDKKEPIELAVIVLDEAVFDLLAQGRDYYDPYKGFYKLESLDLENYNLLTRLVGRQKFEKKGANTGGDVGSDISMRSVFKFVSYWNPSLKTDKAGNASIEFEVPDNLTGWRVFAMAVTPSDRMGLGDEGFKVNRPTEVRPVMPNQVTEGDSFKAGFSVMNRTDKPRKLSVEISVSGPVDNTKTALTHTDRIELAPYKRSTVWMPVQTKDDGELVFTVTARDKTDGDGLKHVVPVKKRRSLETAANYGTTTRDQVTESILFPEAIHDDVGSVSVVTSPTVIGNVKGAFKYMQHYPYMCWEQKLSKGVMASHYLNLKEYMPEDFIWEGSDTLPETTLENAVNFQAPNGGMVYYIPRNKYVSPYLSAYTALAFNWLRHSGYKIPEQVEKKLHAYLDDMLKKDVFPTFFSPGMSSTVRAVALAALAEHGSVYLSDLRRYKPHVPNMTLFGKAHYLQAAIKIKGAESIAKDVATQILAHSSQTGGKFFFNEELDDSFKRILATPMRANAAILSAFTALGEKKYGASLVGDVPFKLVRSITQTRGNRNHWENTQENMFCMNGLIEYSRLYEKETPDMTVKALMDAKLLGKTEFKALRDDPVTFERPIKEGDPGRKTEVRIERKGKGRLYYSARVTFAPLEEHATRTNAGIEIRREYSVERDNKWIMLKSPMEIKRGELIRVDIFLSLPTVRNFVVVDDPIPGGLEPVNRDLATASDVDADKGDFQAAGGSWWFTFSDWCYYNVSRWSFYHKELRHDAARFYSDYLPAGNYHLSYTAQAIAAGEFVEMPVHAEEMYDPDVYGKGIPGTLRVLDE